MKKITIIIMAILAISYLSCNNAKQTVSAKDNKNVKEESQPTSAEDNNIRGAAFEVRNVQEFGAFMTAFEGQDTMEAIVTGKVESVCQAKGCWMNIVSEDGKKEMFVKFVDYAFFMPMDLAGKTVTMKGTAYREVTPVDELRHYAEDEGLPKEEIEAITEPKEEMKFMASGVIIGEQK